MKQRLEQNLQDLEKRVVLAELNQSSLEEANFVLQQEKHDLSVEKDMISRAKEEELIRMQNEKDLEFQHAVARAKSRENNLEITLQNQHEAAEQQMREVQETHTGEMTTLTNQHREVIAQLREEIKSLSRAHDAAIARLAREKDSVVASMEDEKSLLAEQISKLEILLDEKSDELRCQRQHSGHMAAEQKVHIEWF